MVILIEDDFMFFGRHEDHYDFLIVLVKPKEKVWSSKAWVPAWDTTAYERERTLHDGKWLLIRVDDLKTLEAVKKLILIKKKPNRKPFPKENAVYGVSSWICDAPVVILPVVIVVVKEMSCVSR